LKASQGFKLNPKLQVSSSKTLRVPFGIITKSQIPMLGLRIILSLEWLLAIKNFGIGAWNLFGVWVLLFGILV
jgi:hypothetical protein